MSCKPYMFIAGPTAAGKTQTAVELALLIGGEVISADSMQIYKYMDIGTAKPLLSEQRGVPHYLIDEIYPDEPYSAYEFQKRASARAEDIVARNKLPIICGGTGFYLNALAQETSFTETTADMTYREELTVYAKNNGADCLHAMLLAVDPIAAAEIHPNNIKRVVRALEYHKQTGQPISAHNATQKEARRGNARIAILSMERGLLYDRINYRVDNMISAGLVGEVEGLLNHGYGPSLVSMQGLGYKETARYLLGEHSLADAITDIKTGTRHFAKRQLTWFSRQCDGIWYDVTAFSSPRELAEVIASDFKL